MDGYIENKINGIIGIINPGVTAKNLNKLDLSYLLKA